MDIRIRDRILTLSTAVLILVGIVFVAIVSNPTLTLVGFGLIVIGLLVFIWDARDLVMRADKDRRK